MPQTNAPVAERTRLGRVSRFATARTSCFISGPRPTLDPCTRAAIAINIRILSLTNEHRADRLLFGTCGDGDGLAFEGNAFPGRVRRRPILGRAFEKSKTTRSPFCARTDSRRKVIYAHKNYAIPQTTVFIVHYRGGHNRAGTRHLRRPRSIVLITALFSDNRVSRVRRRRRVRPAPRSDQIVGEFSIYLHGGG